MVTQAPPTTSRHRWHFRSNRQCELCVNWNSHAIQYIFDIAWPLFSNEVLKTSHSSPAKTRYWCLFWVKNVNTVPDFSLPSVVQYRVLVHRIHYDVIVMFNRKVLLACQLCTKWRLSMDTLSVLPHYDDVIMTTMASQITSLTVVYSIVYSGVDQIKHQSSASLAFVRGIHRDRWIPRTNGQWRGKCFHLMTSSCAPLTREAPGNRWNPSIGAFPAQRVAKLELRCVFVGLNKLV